MELLPGPAEASPISKKHGFRSLKLLNADMDQLLPLHPVAVHYGTLDNGLRYYVRSNSKPRMRAALALAVTVGYPNLTSFSSFLLNSFNYFINSFSLFWILIFLYRTAFFNCCCCAITVSKSFFVFVFGFFCVFADCEIGERNLLTADQFLKKRMSVELLTLWSILLSVPLRGTLTMTSLSFLRVLEPSSARARMPPPLLMTLSMSCLFPLTSLSSCLRPFRFWLNSVLRYQWNQFYVGLVETTSLIVVVIRLDRD